MSFGIKPLGTRVVIKKVEAEEKTQGGIILTSSAKEQPQMAEVVAVGPGTKDEPMEVKAGEKVIFSKYAGTEVKYQGEEYTIMSQADILATVEQGQGEVLEIGVLPEFSCRKLMDLNLPKRAIIGIIERKNAVIIPKGDTELRSGDVLIIFTKAEDAPEIKKFFKVK